MSAAIASSLARRHAHAESLHRVAARARTDTLDIQLRLSANDIHVAKGVPRLGAQQVLEGCSRGKKRGGTIIAAVVFSFISGANLFGESARTIA